MKLILESWRRYLAEGHKPPMIKWRAEGGQVRPYALSFNSTKAIEDDQIREVRRLAQQGEVEMPPGPLTYPEADQIIRKYYVDKGYDSIVYRNRHRETKSIPSSQITEYVDLNTGKHYANKDYAEFYNATNRQKTGQGQAEGERVEYGPSLAQELDPSDPAVVAASDPKGKYDWAERIEDLIGDHPVSQAFQASRKAGEFTGDVLKSIERGEPAVRLPREEAPTGPEDIPWWLKSVDEPPEEPKERIPNWMKPGPVRDPEETKGDQEKKKGIEFPKDE